MYAQCCAGVRIWYLVRDRHITWLCMANEKDTCDVHEAHERTATKSLEGRGPAGREYIFFNVFLFCFLFRP